TYITLQKAHLFQASSNFFCLCGKMPSAPGFLSGMTSSPLARAKLPKSLIEYGCCLSIQLLDLYPCQKERDPSAAVHRHLRNTDFSRARVGQVQLPKSNQQPQRQEDEKHHFEERLRAEAVEPIGAGQQETPLALQIVDIWIPV